MARNKGIPGSKRNKKRKKQQKKTKRSLAVGRILIVCEGAETEPNYFKWWQEQLENIKQTAKPKTVSGIDIKNLDDKIEVKGEGRNTISLIEDTVVIRNQASIDYTEVWCVFDRDSFPSKNYNAAIEKTRANKFKAAYSNEAFELWYWLHFDYINTGVSRKQYKGKLTQRLGEKYKKNDPQMYEKLLKHPKADQQRAIERAKKLVSSYGNSKKYADHNPSTTVFELVESLNKHVWRFRCQIAPDYELPYPHDCKEEACEERQSSPPYPCFKTINTQP